MLDWVGQRARWILLTGCIAALFLPALSSALRPVLPFIVMLVLGLAMARINLLDTAQRALTLPRLRLLLFYLALTMPALATCAWAFATILGLPPFLKTALVLMALAPPIGSAASLCLMMGFDAVFAVEITVLASLLTPFIGPTMASVLLPDQIGLETIVLMRALAWMVGGALVIGIGLRLILGESRIERHARSFDGAATLAMVAFVVPLFDGVGARILADPILAGLVFLLVFGLMFALNYGVYRVSRMLGIGDSTAGAAGVMQMRNMGLYFAALPPDPAFGLFVALYQFPMYATPLLTFWRNKHTGPQG